MIVVEIAQEREISLTDLLLSNLLSSVLTYSWVVEPVYYTTNVYVPTYTNTVKKVNSPYLPDYGCVIYRSK